MTARILRYLGLGEEQEFGTAVPAAMHRDLQSATLDTPDDPLLHYDGGMGRMRRLVRPGYYSPSGNITLGADVDVLARAFNWALGKNLTYPRAIVVSGSTGGTENITDGTYHPAGKIGTLHAWKNEEVCGSDEDEAWIVHEKGADYPWRFVAGTSETPAEGTVMHRAKYAGDNIERATFEAVDSAVHGTAPSDIDWENEPSAIVETYGDVGIHLPSFTSRIGKDLASFEHVFAGCTIDTLELAVDDSYAMLTMGVAAVKDSKTTMQEFCDIDLGAETMLAFHELKARAGVETARIRSMSLVVNNNLDVDGGRGVGRRHPYRLPAGAREVDVSLSLWFEDTQHLERFWGGSNEPAATGPTEFKLEMELVAPTGERLVIHLPTCIYPSVTHQPSGRARMDEEVTINALMGTVPTVGSGEQCTDIYVAVEV